MNIALSTPNFWPYVRRGTARYISLLAEFLHSKGHKVTVLAATPGPSRQQQTRGALIRYFHYRQHPLLLNYVDRTQTFAIDCFLHFIKGNYDVIYCMHHPDGFAATLARRFKNIKFLFNITGVPFSKYWGHSRIHRYMFEKSVRGADGLLLPSRFSHECMGREFNLTGEVIPMPVDISAFKAAPHKDLKAPTVLFVSDLLDHRKGLHILLPAFYKLKQREPGAKLVLAGQVDSGVKKKLAQQIPAPMQSSVHIPGQGSLADLPHLYARSAMTVLPSIDEVFGMVLLESLASGTPVVGSCSGAIPEIITGPHIGSMFDPLEKKGAATNVEGLYQAMLEVLEMARQEKNGDICRQYAMEYDISRVGERVENYLLQIAADSMG